MLVLCVAGEPKANLTIGVWMRPDGIEGEDPAILSQILRERGIGAVFYLVPFPPEKEEIAQLKLLKSNLEPDIALHLWLTVFRNARYLDDNPDDAFVSTEPLSEPWINPMSTNYLDSLVDGIGELVSDVGPEGLFLDYFYVPFGPFDNSTLSAFSSYIGKNVTVSNITKSTDLLGSFLEWRNDRMVEMLRMIRRKAPELILSIFVIMLEESERLARGQDVERFSEIVDFLVPNTYHFLAGRDASWVGGGVLALKASGGRSVWSGIQAYDIPPKEVRKAIESAVDSGADGVVLFRYGTMTEEHWEQVQLAMEEGFQLEYLVVSFGVVLLLAIILWYRRGKHRMDKPTMGGRAKRRKKPR